jgi:hypothetical protein
MPTKVGVGESKEIDPYKAGVEATQMALDQAGVEKCDFVFMFATVGYEQKQLLKGVRSVTGNAPLSGCSGEGIITQSGPDEEVMLSISGLEKQKDVVGVMVFSSDEINFYNYVQTGLKENSSKVGEDLAKEINAEMPENPITLLMFFDCYATNIENFFSGINKKLKKPLLFCGGFSGHNLKSSPITYQYYNDQVLTDAITSVLISGNAKVEIGVSHGCEPIGLEKTITKSKENIVYEVNNKTAWKFLQEYLGEDVTELNSESGSSVSIGQKLSDEMSTEYDKYIIRSPYIKNPDESITFGTEIPEGTIVSLVRRDEDKISEGAKKVAQRLKTKLGNKKPLAVFHFDCSGRGKMFFGDKVKKKGIDVIQDVFCKDIPWLGFYCFGEIAPINNINFFHNLTVVLCVIYK